MRNLRRTAVCGCAGCLIVLAVVAGAQPASQRTSGALARVATDSTSVRVAELAASIQQDIAVSDRYYARLPAASREDSVVIRSQLFDVQSGMVEKLHELAATVVELEKRSPQPELRSEVEKIFARLTPRVWNYLSMLRGEIDRQRALRPGTAPAARPELEDRIARMTKRLDTVFDLAYAHLGSLASFGIATAADTTALRTELEERADELSGRMKIASERIGDLVALQKEAPDQADTRALLLAERKALKTESSSMTAIVGSMEALNIPTRAARAQLVLVTRDLTSGLFSPDVVLQLAAGAWNRVRVWFRANGPGITVKILLFVGIILLFRILAQLARTGAGKVLDKKQGVTILLRRMAIQASGTVVMLVGLIVALGQLGISLGPLVAGLGVAGFIVGFALQDTLANFAAGLMILIYRPYDVGDVIEVTGAFGKVERMSLVSTSIVTFDNQMIVVPNSKIWGDVIKNVTHQTMRRVDMEFGISYADDIPKAEGILAQIVKEHPKVMDDPAPVIRLNKLNESSVDFVVRPWVARDDYWDVYWDVTREVKMRFDREGISIPFPQRDVHVYQEGGAPAPQ